jgi:hypothetical protein
MRKIFIATPAYQGTVHVQYAIALVDLCKVLELHGFEPVIRIPVSGSLLVADRNRLVEMFWQSEADFMLCLDSDLGFDPRAVLRLIMANKDFSGGVYPGRDGKGFNFRPVVDTEGKIESCKDTGLLKMQYIPAGFMLIKRSMIEKMRNDYPELWYSPKDPRSGKESAFCFFNTELYDGEFWGEDYVFCRRARQSGFDIWIDPYIMFDHAGVQGALIQALTDKKEEAE